MEDMEGKVRKVTVSYNLLPWFFYPSNLASHFPVRPILRKYAKFPLPPKTIATIRKDGSLEGKVAKFNRPGIVGKAFYGAAYKYGDTLDPISEWAQDPRAERLANNDLLPFDRKTVFVVSPIHRRNITVQQQRKSFFDSWYGLPFKFPVYILAFPLNIFKKSGEKELVEIGKLYEVEGLPDSSDIKLDENLMERIFTLGLGKYYDIRDQNQTILFKIKRSPFIKLLTLGLKNSYSVKFNRENNYIDYQLSLGMVDYLNREISYRFKKAPEGISLDDIFQYQ